MFKLNPNPTFTADVKISQPGQDALAVLTLTFKHKGRIALKAWIDSAATSTDPALLGEVIESWRGVVADDGGPVPYGADTLAAVLDAYPSAGAQIFDAYLKELSGGRAKN